MKRHTLLSKSILAATLLFSCQTLFADVTIDGDLSDWNLLERINTPALPPALDNTDAVYGKYDETQNAYVFAIKTTGTAIGANTTFWLNTDNDTSTGFQVWGSYGGAEYFVNIYSGDNKPYLYKGDGTFVTGPLDHSYNSDQTILEISVPTQYLNNPSSTIGVIGDINDQIFFPQYYSQGSLYVDSTPLNLPPRTDFSKRVAIVYSQTSKDHFYDINLPVQKAYSQLFMTMQYHAMMAGIPFDLINEEDLTDISNIVNYDTIIFPNFAYIPTDKLQQIHNTLYAAVYHYGIGFITAGDWMTNKSDGSAIDGDAYANMKQMLGIGRVDGNGPVAVSLNACNTTHPVMQSYNEGENILQYDHNRWFSYFTPVSNGVETQPVTTLATQTVSGDLAGTYDAVMAIQTGGRHVHFSSLEFMGDSNLLWSAIRWSVFGEARGASLKMGRFNNLFVSRNDMDQSQEIDEVVENDGALLDLLGTWKQNYNFVGSYYINIGNNPPDQQTDWNYSAPLYRSYIDLGNEIGTHSYTHPHDTNILTASEIEFEFKESMDIIASYLNPTWRDQNIRGGAVPGAPEGLDTAKEIMQYVDYLTGGYSGVGAGYPGAFGYLLPGDTKVYLSPNMSFDFTLIEFGIPVWDEASQTYVPQPLTPSEAEQHWQEEYHKITSHASLPIIHWPWHDYGPTSGVVSGLYTQEMFSHTIETAYNEGAEFLTGADLAQRIENFKSAKIEVESNYDTINVHVSANDAGKFSITLPLEDGEKIASVDNWYAYSDDKLFLDQDGGDFTIHIGSQSDSVTHITKLPMRAELLSLEGDGNNLSFSFKGEGVVEIALAQSQNNYTITGIQKSTRARHGRRGGHHHTKKGGHHRRGKRTKKETRDVNLLQLNFSSYGIHNITIQEK